MAEPVEKYKVVIGSEVKGSFGKKGVDAPKYFDSLEKVRDYIAKRKKEILVDKQDVWFVKVWEFGKEDYIDMEWEEKGGPGGS